MARYPLALALAVLVASGPRLAVAAPAPQPPLSAGADQAETAARKKAQGKALFNRNKYVEALAALEEAFRLAPDAATAITIADINRYLGEQVAEAQGSARARRAQAHWMDAYNWVDRALGLPTTKQDLQTADEVRRRVADRVAVVEVVTQPGGASLAVDGLGQGVRRSIAVEPGPHHLALSLPGHRTRALEITALLGRVAPVRFVFERLMVDVRVESVPPGAQLFIAEYSAPLPRAPATVRLPVGPAKIGASLDGYLAQTRELEIPEAGLETLVLRLPEDPATIAALTVNGTPGAAVAIDGRAAGVIPLSLRGPKPPSGKAQLQVSGPGLSPWQGQVPLEAGGVTRVDVALVPPAAPPSKLWKWLGYAGGGVLLGVGVGVAGVAASQRSSFDDQPSRAKFDSVNHLNASADVLMATGATALVATGLFHLLSAAPPQSKAVVNLDVERGR